MTKRFPSQAFILAAGRGTRLRPHTDNMPKPMVKVGGKPIIEQTIRKLENFGVTQIVINLHYLGKVIEDYLNGLISEGKIKSEIIFSHENELLDTGGGVRNAIGFMQDEPFFLINGDALWSEGDKDIGILERLSSGYDRNRYDMSIVLQPLSKMSLTSGSGDYDLDISGVPIRNKNKQGKFMFTGLRIVDPALFGDDLKNCKNEVFSFLDIMDDCEKRGKLQAIIHEGEWFHISTPYDLDAVNYHFRNIVDLSLRYIVLP